MAIYYETLIVLWKPLNYHRISKNGCRKKKLGVILLITSNRGTVDSADWGRRSAITVKLRIIIHRDSFSFSISIYNSQIFFPTYLAQHCERSIMGTKRKLASEIPHICGDIIFNILLRLSAETVHGLRSVCKLWSKIISSPDFIDVHLQLSKPGLLFKVPKQKSTLFFVKDIRDSESKFITLPQIAPTFTNRFLSSSNGLVLFSASASDGIGLEFGIGIGIGEKLFVANPLTKRLLQLPSPPNAHARYFIDMVYVASTGEYKVINFFVHNNNNDNASYGCETLTLGGHTWKSVDVPSAQVSIFNRVAMISDLAHWKGWPSWGSKSGSEPIVLSLSMTDAKAHTIKLPPFGKAGSLFEIGGCLSCIVSARMTIDMNIWVLKDEEWVLLHTIGIGRPILANATLQNGEVVIFTLDDALGNYLTYVAYDVHLKEIRYLDHLAAGTKTFYFVMPYCESLVSWSKVC